MNAKLHHFTCNIAPGTLETVIELFRILGCSVSYRKGDERWCMVEQKPLKIDIQMIETDDAPIPIEVKTNTHIAFISDSPEEDIDKIRRWAESKGIVFRQGKWYDKALWFDLPEIFTNFVVELMHTSVVE